MMATQKKKQGKTRRKNTKAIHPIMQSKWFKQLSPQKIAVITALLTDALEVNSILVDKDQTVQIVLEGSLRRKTRLDNLMDELTEMKLGDVLDSLQRRS